MHYFFSAGVLKVEKGIKKELSSSCMYTFIKNIITEISYKAQVKPIFYTKQNPGNCQFFCIFWRTVFFSYLQASVLFFVLECKPLYIRNGMRNLLKQ